MIVEAIVLGIIIGLIRKGKFVRLEYLKIHLSPLIFIAMFSFIGIIVMNLGLLNFNSDLYTVFLVLTYVLIIIVLAFNLDKRFMFLPFIGTILNFICMCLNHFKIPVKSTVINTIYGNEMYKFLLDGKVKFFVPAEEASLKMLGKIFYLGDYYIYDVILSIGDILIAVGIVLVIQALMTDKFLKTRDSITLSKSLYKPKSRRKY